MACSVWLLTVLGALGCRAPAPWSDSWLDSTAAPRSTAHAWPSPANRPTTTDDRRGTVRPVGYDEPEKSPRSNALEAPLEPALPGLGRIEEVPAGEAVGEAPLSRPPAELDPVAPPGSDRPLLLAEVTESVYFSFPALEAALREFDIAQGKATSTWGEFDLKLKAESMADPLGYYKTYRSLVRLEQALWPGGQVYGQYRLGDGNFPVYYDERKTNEGGEFKVAWVTPLLRDRRIDERRANIFQATLKRQQVDPYVQGQLLEFTLASADAYWSWVAAGLSLRAQRELLQVTIERNRVYEERVKREDLAPIELVQNERLIAAREVKVLEAERKLQQAAIKVSLFLRDDQGRAIIPARTWLPTEFPPPVEPDRELLDDHVSQALADRPELREIAILRQQAEVDLAAGQNLHLPSLNAVVEASKDVGAPADVKNTRGPFEMGAGLYFEVPLQRRKADGQITAAQGKLSQLAAKRRFVESKITVEVQDALSALITSYERVARAHRNVVLARQLENAERKRFEAQDSDLLRVAIQETAEIEATLLEIETLADYYKARAEYRAARAVNPLQADE